MARRMKQAVHWLGIFLIGFGSMMVVMVAVFYPWQELFSSGMDGQVPVINHVPPGKEVLVIQQ